MKMFDFYEFKKRHLLVWVVSLLSMALIWYLVVNLLLFLNYNTPWKVIVVVFAVAFIVAFLSQIGLLTSPLFENQWSKLLSLTLMLPGLLVISLILYSFDSIAKSGFLRWIYLVCPIIIIAIYLLQIVVILKTFTKRGSLSITG